MPAQPSRRWPEVGVEMHSGWEEADGEVPALRTGRLGLVEIRFECVFEGKRLYQVLRREAGQVIFTGTTPQCRRFLDIYLEKVARARPRDRRMPRTIPALAR
jgi:hypothetical protein